MLTRNEPETGPENDQNVISRCTYQLGFPEKCQNQGLSGRFLQRLAPISDVWFA